MRQFLQLDLRNIKDIHVRSQLRKIADYVSDAAKTFVSEELSPSQPGNVTNINNTTIVQPVVDSRKFVVFDDCQRDIDPNGGTVNIAAGIGEIGWFTFVSTPSVAGVPTNVRKDTTTFDQTVHPGVWRIEPGGNVGELTEISPVSAVTQSPYSICRSREKLTVRIGAAISATTQRQHFRAGLGYYPANAEWPAFFIGFVWWYVDQDYSTQANYAPLTLLNDPGVGTGQQDMFLAEVVDNNVARAIMINKASGHTTIDDLLIEIEGGKVNFSIHSDDMPAGQYNLVATLDDIAVGSGHGAPLVAMRSHGTNNPGGNRRGFLDYFGLSG